VTHSPEFVKSQDNKLPPDSTMLIRMLGRPRVHLWPSHDEFFLVRRIDESSIISKSRNEARAYD